MTIASLVVVPDPIASGADADTITTLLVLAAAVGWFLWRRNYLV